MGFDQFGRTTDVPGIVSVTCPVFVKIGAENEHVRVLADLAIERNAIAAPRVESHVVASTDHSFTGREVRVATLLEH